MIDTKARIIANERLTKDYWRITLDVTEIVYKIKPGQFINIRLSKRNDPYFRRPFSVFRRVKLTGGNLGIEVVYKVVGVGTNLMTLLREGDKLDIIGPLGHGFEQNLDKRTQVLLAGGIGAASLFLLAEEISRLVKQHELELYLLLGAETESTLILTKEFKALGGKVLVSTDDGTYGYQGSVIEMLTDALEKGNISSDCAIYAYGPEPMYRALSSICQQYNIPAQIAMERHMMCGVGACLCCVCYVKEESVSKYRDLSSSHILFESERQYGHALVCRDGPVFHIDEVILDG